MSVYIITILAFLIIFGLGYSWLYNISKNLSDFTPLSIFQKDTFFPIWLLAFIGVSLFYFYTTITDDIIYTAPYYHIPIIFLFSGAIYFSSLFKKTKRYSIWLILVGAGTCSFFIPPQFTLFNASIPFVLDRIIIVFFLFSFSWLYQLFNNVDGLLSIFSLNICIGIFLLSLLGGVPHLLGNYAIIFIGLFSALLIFTWYPKHLILSDRGANSVGFILGWLLLQCSQEGSSGCVLIFIMPLFAEFSICLIRKFSLNPQYKNLFTNTNYYQALASGLSPLIICQFTTKFYLLLIIFGCFQLYSPNAYSIPILTYFICIWSSNRFKNWNQSIPKISQIHQDFIQNLHQDFTTIKTNFKNKHQNKKDDK